MAASSLRGKTALMTGPFSSLALTAARRLGREGVLLALAGRHLSSDYALISLQRQFSGSLILLNADIMEPSSIEAAAREVDRVFKRLDILIHTVGAPHEAPGHTHWGPFLMNSVSPFTAALMCSSGALKYMVERRSGHILHLVIPSEVGAEEVEEETLRRLRNIWAGNGSPEGVRISVLYLEETRLLPQVQGLIGEARVLELATGRTMEEEDWAERIFREDAIGELVLKALNNPAPIEVSKTEQGYSSSWQLSLNE